MRAPFKAIAIAAVVAFGALSACGDDDAADDGQGGSGGLPPPPGSDIVITGAASDEALEAILDADASEEPSQAVVVDVPGEGETVGVADLTLAYHVGAESAAHFEHQQPIRRPRLDVPAGYAERFFRLFVGEAHAHGPPVNGRAYLITFKGADGEVAAQAFTTDLTYDPDSVVEAKLAEAPQPVTIVIDNAVFEDNVIVSDGGPFAGIPLAATLVP